MTVLTPRLAGRYLPDGWRWPIAIALFAGAVVYSFWWTPGLFRPWNDFAFVYAAGRSWLSGVSPYDFDRWNLEWAAVRPAGTHVAQPMPFMYPPHWGPFATLLALPPFPVALHIWDAICAAAYFGACAFSLKLHGGDLRALVRTPAVWVFLAFATFNPALRYSFSQSQMTVVPIFGVVGAFWAWHEKKTGWLIVFAFLASLKPQLGLLALLYLFLNGGHAGVLWAGAAAAGVAILSLLPVHIELFPAQFAHCLRLHKQLDFNQPGTFFNLPALAAGFLPGDAFMLAGPVLAAFLVVALTWMRRQDRAPAVLRDPLWQLSLVAALTAALMPLHAYDLVIYTPLALLAYRLRASWTSLILVAFILGTGRPNLFASLHLSRIGPVLTLACAAAVAVEAFRNRSRQTAWSGRNRALQQPGV